jgi:ATP adenylyltransferase
MKHSITLFLFLSIFSALHGEHEIFHQLEEVSSCVIHAPWRDSYSNNIKPCTDSQEKKPCPFCKEIQANSDEQFFILRRFKYNVVSLNIFPYAKGHILIIPLEHVAHLNQLSSEARAEIIELANLSLVIVQKVYKFPGANIGFNIGAIAGSTIPDHLHLHVVPRLETPSFMPVIANTSVATFDLRKVYKELKDEFDAIVMG